MEDQLISFETAKLAKEKGFGGKGLTTSNGYFRGNNLCNIPCNNKSDFCGKDEFSAPTQSLLQKWLRDLHGVDIHITRNKPSYREYRVEIYKVDNTPNYIHFQINTEKSNGCKWFDDYEEALETALLEALKLIK